MSGSFRGNGKFSLSEKQRFASSNVFLIGETQMTKDKKYYEEQIKLQLAARVQENAASFYNRAKAYHEAYVHLTNYERELRNITDEDQYYA